MQARRRWLVALLALLAAGCYTVPESTFPARYQSIYIPALTNETIEPQLHSRVTHALRQEFQNMGQLRVVNSEAEADLVLHGTLTDFGVRATSYDDNDVPRQFTVTVTGDVVVEETGTGNVVWRRRVVADDFYDTSRATGARPRDEGLNEAAEEFAERVVFDLVDSAW